MPVRNYIPMTREDRAIGMRAISRNSHFTLAQMTQRQSRDEDVAAFAARAFAWRKACPKKHQTLVEARNEQVLAEAGC